MEPLVIEYLLSGQQRGYNFTSPTRGYDEETLKKVWRGAMPRGQGWGADVLLGARALKCFPVDDRRLALAEVTVTDQKDESGRKGIRRAVVRVLQAEVCAAYLRSFLNTYPTEIQRQLDRLPTPAQWAQVVGRVMPFFGKAQQQLILTHAYDRQKWLLVEGMIIKLALALQVGLKRHQSVVPFTTLALDAREEMMLVGVPTDKLSPDLAQDSLPISF